MEECPKELIRLLPHSLASASTVSWVIYHLNCVFAVACGWFSVKNHTKFIGGTKLL